MRLLMRCAAGKMLLLAACAAVAVAAIMAGPAPAVTQPAPISKARWQAEIARVREPGTGCYQASYPALQWHAVKCVTAPMRARDLCQALDLPIAPKNTENIRSKLKRLTSSPEKRMIRRGPADASWNELHATSWLTSTDCVGLRVIRGRLQPTR
jgi:hypothetical protein